MDASKEDLKLKCIEQKLATLKDTFAELIPVWNILDRKRIHLELEMKMLEDERMKITDGQMVFDSTEF